MPGQRFKKGGKREGEKSGSGKRPPFLVQCRGKKKEEKGKVSGKSTARFARPAAYDLTKRKRGSREGEGPKFPMFENHQSRAALITPCSRILKGRGKKRIPPSSISSSKRKKKKGKNGRTTKGES